MTGLSGRSSGPWARRTLRAWISPPADFDAGPVAQTGMGIRDPDGVVKTGRVDEVECNYVPVVVCLNWFHIAQAAALVVQDTRIEPVAVLDMFHRPVPDFFCAAPLLLLCQCLAALAKNQNERLCAAEWLSQPILERGDNCDPHPILLCVVRTCASVRAANDRIAYARHEEVCFTGEPCVIATRTVRTILWAGLIAGALDITAAFVVYARSAPSSIRLLQGIAYALIGKAAMEGGVATAILGLACHFFIATSWAAVYVAASRRARFLLEHPVVSGAGYGLIIYVVMNHIVVPLSAIGPGPFSLSAAIVAAVILVLCVGLPIALIVRWFAAHDPGVAAPPAGGPASGWNVVPKARGANRP